MFPNELKNEWSMEEKRRTLKKIPDDSAMKEYNERAGVKVCCYLNKISWNCYLLTLTIIQLFTVPKQPKFGSSSWKIVLFLYSQMEWKFYNAIRG